MDEEYDYTLLHDNDTHDYVSGILYLNVGIGYIVISSNKRLPRMNEGLIYTPGV